MAGYKMHDWNVMERYVALVPQKLPRNLLYALREHHKERLPLKHVCPSPFLCMDMFVFAV